MPSSPQAIAIQPKLVVYGAELSQGSSNSPISTEYQEYNQRLLRLYALMQTSLDSHSLLQTFGRELAQIVAFDGMSLINTSQELSFQMGKVGKHLCTFQLVVNELSLGDLTFSRVTPFTLEEQKQLEYFLRTLVYPLRNSLAFKKAQEAAHKDSLTGANNRGALNTILRREVELAHRHDKPLSIILLDIDHFKVINDTHGHIAGDCVLTTLADCVEDCMRGTDMLFRYGGEEFVVLLSNTNSRGAQLLAKRLRKRVEETLCECDQFKTNITISLGVATLQSGDKDQDLFEKADRAMYQAKNDGRNCVRVAE